MTAKTLIATALIALSAAAVPAFAQSYSHLDPITQSQKSRAEVLADLEIYRESGLAAVDRTEDSSLELNQRAKAEARYAEPEGLAEVRGAGAALRGEGSQGLDDRRRLRPLSDPLALPGHQRRQDFGPVGVFVWGGAIRRVKRDGLSAWHASHTAAAQLRRAAPRKTARH